MAKIDPYSDCSTEGASGIKSGDYIHQNDLILLRQKLIALFNKRDNPANNSASSLKSKKLKEITDKTFDFNNDGQQDTSYQNAQNEYITFNHGDNSIQHCLIINDYQELKNQSSQDLILKDGISNDTGLIGWITDLINTNLTSSNSGCRGACTGICVGSCYSGCGSGCATGCSGCSTEANGSIGLGIGSSKISTCSGCVLECASDCGGVEGWGTTCDGNCANTCHSSCGDGCVGNCKGGCSGGCTGGCYGGCNYGCKDSCNDTCYGGCKNDCSNACLNGCLTTCTSNCIDLCKNTCSTNCSTGCYNSAKT